MPRFSIITCTLNDEKTLFRSLQSIEDQGFDNIEHIIIDGDSTDQTKSIIENYCDKVVYPVKFKSIPRKGVYNAFNVALSEASGEIIVFLNADDWIIKSNYLTTLQNYFLGGFSIVYSDLIMVDEFQKLKRYWEAGNCTKSSCKFGRVPPHPSFVCLREVYEKIGYFDEKFKIAADLDFMIRAFMYDRFQIAYEKQVFVAMQIGGVSNNSLKAFYLKILEDYQVFQSNNFKGIIGVIGKRLIKISQYMRFVQNGVK